MTLSDQSKQNIANADRAIVARLRGAATRPDRWYVMLVNADNSRASAVCGDDGFVMLFSSSGAARSWLKSVRPDLTIFHGKLPDKRKAE